MRLAAICHVCDAEVSFDLWDKEATCPTCGTVHDVEFEQLDYDNMTAWLCSVIKRGTPPPTMEPHE